MVTISPKIPFQGENSQISFDLTSSELKIKKKEYFKVYS